MWRRSLGSPRKPNWELILVTFVAIGVGIVVVVVFAVT
jgi:hypothetical protein